MINEIQKVAIIGAGSKTADTLIRVLSKELDMKFLLFSSQFSVEKAQSPKIVQYPISATDKKQLKAVLLHEQPSFIINCAAMTNVDGCEDNKQLAWSLNVTAVETLVQICKITGSHLIHFSTDYVFDGLNGPYAETDKPNPISYYGKSKLAGENVCLPSGIDVTVLRTNVVYSSNPNKGDFVHWVIKMLEKELPITVVSDQYSNPTITDDLAYAVLKVILKGYKGLYHIAGSEYCNRVDFAKKIAQIYMLDESNIHPITTAELHQKAKRPLKGGLQTLKAQSEFGIEFLSVESGLIMMRNQLFSLGYIKHK